MAGIAACSGQSCSCITPIPGGFPATQERLNGVQARLTSSFMDYVSANAPAIVPNLLPGGTTFTIPPVCTGSTKICCATPQPLCQIEVTPTALTLTPAAPNNLHFSANLEVKTLENIPVDSSIGTCIASFDSTRSGDPYIVATGDLAFNVDGTTRLTNLALDNPSINDVDTGDLHLNESGSATLCAVASLGVVKGFIIDSLTSQIGGIVSGVVKGQFCQACNTVADCPASATACTAMQCIGADGTTCIQQLGVQGRADVGSFLQRFSPATRAHIDLIEAAGGYASADTGLSLGVLGGSLADPHSACVPIVAPPTPTDVGPSSSFTGDVIPGTTTPYHVGIGVHVSHLAQLGYSFWDGGGLCLGIGGETVSLLSAKALALVMPSLNDLLHTDDAPALLKLRPQNPPTFLLGKGTFKTSGTTQVIDDPLLTVMAPGLIADFYLFIDDRYVRIATLTTDLALPMSLDTDATGGITFIAGDLSKAFTNIHVSNTDLLAESQTQLEASFPTLLSVSIGALLGSIPALHLPTLAGLAIRPKLITSVEPDAQGAGQFLAIFADVAQANAAHLGAQTRAQLLEVSTPTTETFSVAHRNAFPPSVTVAVQGTESRPFEWSYAFDGATWHSYQTADTLTLTDDTLWLQGKHTVSIRGRAVGDPASLDTSPVVLPFIIDSQAPSGSFTIEEGVVVAHATDRISAIDALSYRVGNGPFGKSPRLGAAPTAPGSLTVEVRDEAGNIASLPYHGAAATTTGCSMAPHGTSTGPVALLIVAAALLLRRRTRLIAAVIGLSACHHGQSESGSLDPTDQIGRTHDVRVFGTQLHISAYDQNNGDLAYTSIDVAKLTDPLSWTLVDGVDLSAPKDGTTGFRGGRTAAGPDVGYYSSLALTSKGKPHIAYWDATNHALKFANGPAPFSSHTVDMGSADGSIEVGLFPAVMMDVADHAMLVYSALGLGDKASGFSSELRLAYAMVENPKSASDWTISTIESVAIGCGGRCDTGQACTVDAMVGGVANTDPVHSSCVAVDLAPCSPACATGAVCISGVCTKALAAANDGALPEGTGLFAKLLRSDSGQVAVAYYDHSAHRLRLALQSSGGTFLPQTLDGDAGTDYGQHVSAAYGADGTLHLAYVDAIGSSLVYRSVDSTGAASARTTIDDGLRSDGYHPVGASASLLVNGGDLSVLYQDQSTADLELGVGLPFSHSDFLTGATGYGFSSHQIAVGTARYYTSYVVDRSGKPLGHIQLGTIP
ncbi:MAG: hypothetical protein ABI321_00980 [Polyangia bacterium]